jgi:hypothetical protein
MREFYRAEESWGQLGYLRIAPDRRSRKKTPLRDFLASTFCLAQIEQTGNQA